MTTNAGRSPHDTRVVITGLGAINPLGNNVEDFWDALVEGRSGVRLARNVDLSNYKIKIGAEIDLPDITDYFPKAIHAKRFDRFIVLAFIAATQALKDSGLRVDEAPHRYGVLIGTGDGGVGTQIESITDLVAKGEKGISRVSPFYVVSHIPNTASSYFAAQFGLKGPNFSINSACASSNHAIGVSAMMIKLGMADVMITGGTEAVVNEMAYGGFGNISALSSRNDSPETASRPFEKNRNGFVLGEGAGIICLEELEHAKRRGAEIYGELAGAGFTCDAEHLVSPQPEGKGMQAAMELAVRGAKLNKEDVDLINAHAPSTIDGDLAESNGICNTFPDRFREILVHSTKSMIGHLIGAANSTEAIAAIMALKRGIVHATINHFEPDPKIPLNIVRNEPMERHINHIVSNSAGFGGQNASIVISRF